MTATTPRPPKTRRQPARGGGQSELLADGSLPCRCCGVAVKNPDPARAEVVRFNGIVTASSATLRVGPAPRVEVPVTRCDDCVARRERAAELLAAHPRVARAHGMVALDRLDAALAALDLGGFRGRRGESMTATLTSSDASLRDLIERLAHLGAAAHWSAGYAGKGVTAHGRWGHVPDILARDTATAVNEVFHRRFETAGAVPPPEDGEPGCLFCGVAAIIARPSERTNVWAQRVRVQPGTLGGISTPDLVSGYLCPDCWAAIMGGAPGLPGVERALLRHLGYKARAGWTLNIPRLTAWVGLRRGTPPNATPWAHVPLDRMAATLVDLEADRYAIRVNAS